MGVYPKTIDFNGNAKITSRCVHGETVIPFHKYDIQPRRKTRAADPAGMPPKKRQGAAPLRRGTECHSKTGMTVDLTINKWNLLDLTIKQ